jgi:hypothetical protein
MSNLKTFTGYRGVAAFLEVDGIQFYVTAPTEADLEKLYNLILQDAAEPFSPDHCTKCIVISATLLPEPKKNKPFSVTDFVDVKIINEKKS